MKLDKKRTTIITSIISIALLAGYLGLRAAEVIGEDRTWLPLLIVSWLLILRDYSSLAANGEELKIAGLLSVGAIWFHVSAYFHKTMGFPSSTVNQLKMCIYRKRALGLFCAIFLICVILIPDEGKMAQWLFIVMGLTFVLLFSSKFVIGYVK